MKKVEGPRRRLGVLALVGLLIMAVLPVGTAMAEPPDLPIEPASVGPDGGDGPFAGMLNRLSELLRRLEGELATLEGPRAERLEERLEGAIEAIESLLGEVERPREKLDETAWKARMVKVNLHLHRLVQLLEEIVERTPDRPERPRAKLSIEQLREWIDDYIVQASAGMDSEEYERFERAVRQMAKFLGERISQMAKKVPAKIEPSKLARLVERLEALLFRLDGFLLNQLPKRP